MPVRCHSPDSSFTEDEDVRFIDMWRLLFSLDPRSFEHRPAVRALVVSAENLDHCCADVSGASCGCTCETVCRQTLQKLLTTSSCISLLM
jgi:hypothetical protein